MCSSGQVFRTTMKNQGFSAMAAGVRPPPCSFIGQCCASCAVDVRVVPFVPFRFWWFCSYGYAIIGIYSKWKLVVNESVDCH